MDDLFYEDIKNRIKELIDQLGLTSNEFANSIGVSPSTINHVLNGRNKVSLNTLVSIKEKYKYINADWLMFGTDSTDNRSGDSFSDNLFDVNAESHDPTLSVVGPIIKKSIETNKAVLDRIDSLKTALDNESKPDRQIQEIKVFYDDNSFDTFKKI